MKLNFTDAVEVDLEAIGSHIAKDSPLQAVRFAREIRAHCAHLIIFPHAYPLLSGYEEWGIRRIVHGSHLIFYVVRDDAVDIIRVIHGAMNYETNLFPEQPSSA